MNKEKMGDSLHDDFKQQKLLKAKNATRNTIRSTRTAKKVGKVAASAAKNTAFLAVRHPIITGIVLLLLLLIILISGTSSSELKDTYYLSTDVNSDSIYMPETKEEQYSSLWDKNAVLQGQSRLLAIISEEKEESRDDAIEEIKKMCLNKGWNIEETLAHLKEDGELINTEDIIQSEGKTSGKILETFDISSYRNLSKTSFKYKDIESNFPEDSYQEKLKKKDDLSIDKYGIVQYEGSEGKDYLISLPESFGKASDRFRITFENGTVITGLLFDNHSESKAKKSLLRFFISNDDIDNGVKDAKDLSALYSNLFDKVKKIEKIEGSFKTQKVTSSSTLNTRVLSCYSVSIDNAQIKKVKRTGLRGPEIKYQNEAGDEVDIATNAKGEIDYEKDIRNKLRDYNGDFYSVNYEMSGDEAKTYTKTISTTEIVELPIFGHKYEFEVEREKTINYGVPILLERDVNSIGEELFGVDPEGIYVNGDGKTTNRQAIDTLALNTQSLLYDNIATLYSPGEIFDGGLAGKYLWPAPGVIIVTSDFGPRTAPTVGASTNHKGIDIGTPMNTPIVAVEDGTITLAQWDGGYGKSIILRTKDGSRIRYGHLNQLNASAGKKVKRGEVIAYSGNTGISTGPHLHIEVYNSDGREVDPTLVLVKDRKELIFQN